MMKPFLFFLCSAAILIPLTAGKKITVVELYTSQGCSSCPPADSFLRELAENPGIVALSFHVDYWNYIGWKDPYSSSIWSERQREYAELLGNDGIYTPQMIVNGRNHFVGSNRRKITDFITADRGVSELAFSADLRNNSVSVHLPSISTGRFACFLVRKNISNKVPKGENAGLFSRHANVVFEKIDTEKSVATFSRRITEKEKSDWFVAAFFLQNGKISSAGNREITD